MLSARSANRFSKSLTKSKRRARSDEADQLTSSERDALELNCLPNAPVAQRRASGASRALDLPLPTTRLRPLHPSRSPHVEVDDFLAMRRTGLSGHRTWRASCALYWRRG